MSDLLFALIMVLTVLCGLAFPLALTGIAQILVPWQANAHLALSRRRGFAVRR